MKNKNSYKKILALTFEEDWLESQETIEKVQSIAELIVDNPNPKIDFSRIKSIRVVDRNHRFRTYPTIQECAEKENLHRATITKHIKQKSETKDGRRFFLFYT